MLKNGLRSPRPTRVLFSVLSRSEAEVPPLSRCSNDLEREEAAHAGAWNPGFRGARREGSFQPSSAVRKSRSSAGFAGFCGDGSLDGGDVSAEEVESVGAGGGGVEDVVGWGLIAALWTVVDSNRIDWLETELLELNCLLLVHRTVLDGLRSETQGELCTRTRASAALRSSIGLSLY